MKYLQNLNGYHIILASQSPRRRHLLKELGVPFEAISLEIDETYPVHFQREEIAMYLAEQKARAFPTSAFNNRTLLITADTIVWLEDHTIGKPASREEAIAQLKMLSGKKHEVITAVCLRTHAIFHSFYCCTDVYFNELTDNEIVYYVDSFQPMDKAGAYGIQEWIGYIGISRIDGSYFNVMGLPLQRLYEELKRI